MTIEGQLSHLLRKTDPSDELLLNCQKRRYMNDEAKLLGNVFGGERKTH